MQAHVQRVVRDMISTSERKVVKASAGSKVLISGAYLIIDPRNEGVVLSTDAQFTTEVSGLPPNSNVIRVRSPQFNLTLEYKVSVSVSKEAGEGGQPCVKIEKTRSQQVSNEFIDKCMLYVALTYYSRAKHWSQMPALELLLKGDNSFYSQRGTEYFPDRLAEQPDHQIPADPTKKTGLGSSAALVVSLLAATLTFLEVMPSNKAEFHCHCQLLNAFLANKVGSGFDIAASIYGSQLYRRFSNTAILKDCLVPIL